MSRFAERLAAGEFAVSLEITPPKKRLDDVLLRRARLLGGLADAVNVIQRPDRLPSLDTCLVLLEAGLEPVWHIVNRGRSRKEIRSEAASAASHGIRAALCIRGDHSADDTPATPRIREVITMVREVIPDSLIGATANQYGPRGRVLANLLPKLRAGASFIQTNPVFDIESLRPFAEEVRSRSPDTKIVPMVMPVVSTETAERIQRRLGLAIPPRHLDRLSARGEPAGWEAFTEVVLALAESEIADGIAVMTPEMDPVPPFAPRIASVLTELPRMPATAL